VGRKDDCIFCKIIAGDIPSLRVWDSPVGVAFLDVNPLAEGHTLLVPRQHFADLRDMPPDTLGQLLAVAPALCAAIIAATGATGVNFLQNTGASSGQVVLHTHFHFIPRRDGDGLGYRWNAGNYSEGRAEVLQGAIAEALG